MKLIPALAALTLLASPAAAHPRAIGEPPTLAISTHWVRSRPTVRRSYSAAHHWSRRHYAQRHREARTEGFGERGYSGRPEASRPRHEARYATAGTILPHPAGCPPVQFCGCGAAVAIFGRPIRDLWLAAAWFRFPSASPGTGMVAVRQHHVMVIRQYLGDGRALVFDANSGRHLTREHVVSLRGYSIRDPHGRREARI